MKAKHQRLTLAIVAVVAVMGSAVLAMSAAKDKAAYFRSPADLAKTKPQSGEAFRLGGMVANKSITRGADGVPYKRRDVILETATSQNALFNTGAGASRGIGAANVSGRPSGDVPAMADGRQTVIVPVLPMDGVRPMNGNGTGAGGEFGVRVAGIAEDAGEGRLVYEPGHPDADTSGYVRYPDIDTTQELVHLLDAKRMYEANASVFQTVKAMLRAAIDI